MYPSVVSICDSSSLFCLCISVSLPQFPWFHYSTTAFLEFLHSLSISPSLYPFCPLHKCKRAFSRLMRVLSHSNTHYLFGVYGTMRVSRKEWPVPHLTGVNGIVRVPRNLDPALSHLPVLIESLYSTQLWFWWLSYFNHSFQLISSQYSVQHSDPPRKQQSCYQELFISTTNWGQAYIERHFSCYHSSKVHAFITSTVYKVPSHQRSRNRSLFRKDRRSIFLTTSNTEGMSRWLWQASISFSWVIQRSYSGSNAIHYSLPSLVQKTIRCCLEFNSNPVFECEWATNFFRWKLVDRWIRRGSFLRLDELREKVFQLRRQLVRWTNRSVANQCFALAWMEITF